MKKIFIVIFLAILFFSYAPNILAASTTMGFSPRTGSYNKSFTTDLVIDGHGDEFNAAKATVTVSPNFAIQELTLGDCKFSFTTTPSILTPSFEGIILGGSSKKCTVYTLTLVPVAKGNATITLSQTTVRRFGDAANVLSTTQNANFSLTATSINTAKQIQPTIILPQNGTYTILLKILLTDNKPVENTQITMSSVATKQPLKKNTDKLGNVQFSNIESGVYEITVANKTDKNILNVSGRNHIITLGIKLQPEEQMISLMNLKNIIMPLIIGVIVILFIIICALVIKTKPKSKKTPLP